MNASVALNTLHEQLCNAQQEYHQMLQQSFQLKLDILNCPESERDVKEAEQHSLDNTVEHIRKVREKLQQQLTHFTTFISSSSATLNTSSTVNTTATSELSLINNLSWDWRTALAYHSKQALGKRINNSVACPSFLTVALGVPSQRRLNVAVKAVNALGLQFNVKKSVVLVQGKKAHCQEYKGKAVKRVKEAKWFEESGEWTTHAKERITKAKQALYSLRQQGAIAQGLGTHTAQIATEASVKSTLS